MANDSIRLPSDSTVAPQAIRRGSEQSGAVLRSTTPSTAPEPPSPLATIVLQSKAMVEGKQAGLFLLLVQNDPKSNPPIQLVSDTALQAGTSLLIERDELGQYRPVERITPEQLQRLVQLELDFWQSHLLPKAQKSETVSLPSTQQLQWLALQKPELKPLLQWLMPRTNVELSAQTVQQWIKAFTPLAHRLAWPTPSPATAPQTSNQASTQASMMTPANITATHQPGNQSAVTLNATPPVQSQPAVTTLQLLTRAINIEIPTQPATATSTQVNTASSQSLPPTQAANLGAHPQATAATPSSPTTTPVLTGLTFTLTTPKSHTNILTASHIGGVTVPSPSTSGIANHQKSAAPNQPGTKTIGSAPQGNTVGHNTTSQTPGSTMTPLPSMVASSANTNPQPSIAAGNGNHFLPPPSEGRLPDSRINIVEARLAAWLARSDQAIKQDAPSLQAQLQQRAQQLLYSSELIQGKIKQAMSQHQINAPATKVETESPLLAVRQWLDSTLAKVQSLAVQNAVQQWTAPDQPPVQQAQIPLIWLGLNGWVDIEWWQQKRSQASQDDHEKRKRRWSLRLYLSISPLADICADIDWGIDNTQVIFWSNDQPTLAHLNQLLPTLKAWTQGLSDECEIETKRGFPKRMREKTVPESQHLVDILT